MRSLWLPHLESLLSVFAFPARQVSSASYFEPDSLSITPRHRLRLMVLETVIGAPD